jgi:hypothetical protein
MYTMRKETLIIGPTSGRTRGAAFSAMPPPQNAHGRVDTPWKSFPGISIAGSRTFFQKPSPSVKKELVKKDKNQRV